MSNASRAQDYLMQIVSAGYGFDVPEIQNALMKTNYRSVEAAVEFLFANQSKKGNVPSSAINNASSLNNKPSSVSSKDIEELKRRIAKIELEGNLKISLTTDIMNIAIKENKNTDDALNYIMDRYSHLIKPNDSVVISNKSDVDQYKQKLIDDAMQKKAQQEKEARQREKQIEMDRHNALREEKEKEESRMKHKERVALNRQKVLNKKKKQRLNKKKATLDWHKRHEEYDKKDQLKLEAIEKNRMKHTQHINSPDKALQTLFERYGENEARNTVKMLIKIINNISKHPDNDKYRKINLQKAKIKDTIVHPLGAMKFLEFLGFEERIESDSIFPEDVSLNKKYLVYNNYSSSDCKHAILMLNKYNVIQKTMVYDYFDKMKAKNAINADDLYMGLMYLYTQINNITISPNSQHLRVIEVDQEIFRKRVGQYPLFQKLLKNLGYKLEKRIKGRVFVLKWNDLESEKEKEILFLKNVARDLYTISHDDILMETSIGIGINKIYHMNTSCLNETYKYFNTLIKAMDHILNEPLNMKYQSINIEKLKAKYPNMHGMLSVLKLLGFERDKIAKTMFVLSAEYTTDLELLKWRKVIFQNVINDKKLLKKK